jgi:hypothetical protein
MVRLREESLANTGYSIIIVTYHFNVDEGSREW